MSIKRNFLVGIMDDNSIDAVDDVLFKHSQINLKSSSFMFFGKEPVDVTHTTQDITFLQLEGESESELNENLKNLINDLNELNTDYILRDQESEEILVSVDFVAKLFAKFDNFKEIKPGTFKKIDELKVLRNELGYCKGFKPKFRPIEGNSVENMVLDSEVIYLISDSRENLSKLSDYLSEKLLEIDSNFEIEVKVFKR